MQRMAAKLKKKYFTSKVEQLHSSDPGKWWSKTKRILKLDNTNPLANLDYQGPQEKLPDEINEFFTSVSAHLPKVNADILANLTDDYSSEFIVDPA